MPDAERTSLGGVIVSNLEFELVYQVQPLGQLARLALAERLPVQEDLEIVLSFVQKRDDRPATAPEIRNGRPEFGWVDVVVRTRSGDVVHQKRHRVQELFGPAVMDVLRRVEHQTTGWQFMIGHPSGGELMTFQVPPIGVPDRGTPFVVRRMKDSRIADAARVEIRDYETGEVLATAIGNIERLIGRIGEITETLQGHARAGGREAPRVDGSMEVDLTRRRGVAFSIRKQDEPSLPVFDLPASGIDPAGLDRTNVLLSAEILERFETLPLNGTMEDGGFLIGRIYRIGESDERTMVKLTRVIPAEHSGASSVHFTFTGNSFQALSETLSREPEGDRLVGWWHTHPHGVASSMGLSERDIELHTRTFGQPWHLAGLINLSPLGTAGKRYLRFFVADPDDEEGAVQCRTWFPDDRGGYRSACVDLGHD